MTSIIVNVLPPCRSKSIQMRYDFLKTAACALPLLSALAGAALAQSRNAIV